MAIKKASEKVRRKRFPARYRYHLPILMHASLRSVRNATRQFLGICIRLLLILEV